MQENQVSQLRYNGSVWHKVKVRSFR